ncbi:unnamed protein product, partial [Closterium sp. NIES-64]
VEQGLASVNVPYAYGFSIILLTLLVKVVEVNDSDAEPCAKVKPFKAVESTMAMQNLAPKVKAIQTKYAGDQERIQLETSRCLPTLATLPVFIGLYQALSNVAKEGVFIMKFLDAHGGLLLDPFPCRPHGVLTEGFFWIPSLAGPTSIAARDSGSGISWLFPFIVCFESTQNTPGIPPLWWESIATILVLAVDGVPPLGWEATAAYLVLPVLLVASQFLRHADHAAAPERPQKNTQVILKFLPLMIGWFSLSVPSGLSLYWFTNNLLSTGQTIYLRKMGGATPKVAAGGGDIIDVGQAKRSAASSVVATEQDKEKLRGEQFRKQKETGRRPPGGQAGGRGSGGGRRRRRRRGEGTAGATEGGDFGRGGGGGGSGGS